MGYSVEIREFTIDESEENISFLDEIFRLSLDFTFSDRYAVKSNIGLDERGSIYTISYLVVESDGPIIDLFGWNLDLESGFFLLGEKSNNFIPIVNLYDILEQVFGEIFDRDIFKEFIERFKLGEFEGDLKGKDFGSKLYKRLKNNFHEGNSIISSYLFDNIEYDEENYDTEELAKKIFYPISLLVWNQISERVKSLFKKIGDKELLELLIKEVGLTENAGFFFGELYRLKERVLLVKEIEEYVDIYIDKHVDGHEIDPEYDYELDMGKVSLRNIKGIMKEKYGQKYKEVLDKYKMYWIERERYKNLSDEEQEEILEYRMKMKEVFKDLDEMDKTEVTVLNLYEMLESYGDDRLVGFEMELSTPKEKIDNNQLRKVIDKIGVKEYMKGAKLAHLSKRVKGVHNKDKINDIIDGYIKGNDNDFVTNISMINNKYYEVVEGLKKRNKFYRKVLKDIDKKLR